MKIHIILEKFWLVIASLATILTIYLITIDGFEAAKFYVLIVGLIWGMFLVRRGIRRRFEKFENEKNQDPEK